MEEEKCIQDLVENPEEKRPLGRPNRTWKDNIKVDRKEFNSWFALRTENGQMEESVFVMAARYMTDTWLLRK
jgi:hypothetical protein